MGLGKCSSSGLVVFFLVTDPRSRESCRGREAREGLGIRQRGKSKQGKKNSRSLSDTGLSLGGTLVVGEDGERQEGTGKAILFSSPRVGEQNVQ